VITDRDAVIQYVNPGFTRMTGYTRAEVLGKNPRLLKSGRHDGKFYQELWATISSGKLWRGEFINRRKDGVIYTEEATIAPVRSSGGEITNYIAIKSDITERKRAENAVRESEERLRALMTASSHAIYRMSPDWSEMRQLRGRDFIADTETPSRHWLEKYIHPDDQPHVKAVINEAIRTKSIFELEHRVLRVDGTLGWTFSRAIPLLDANGEIVEWFGAASDVTERKRADEVIRGLNTELEQRVRERTAQLEAANQELEAFAYSVSHDLRAPLRGIDGWSMALLEDYGAELDAKAHTYLDRVRSEAQRLGGLIDDLLKLSRVTRSEMAIGCVNLSSLAETIATRLKEMHPGRTLEFLITPGLTGTGDARLLEIALNNLLDNAVKFTGPRPEARIEVGKTVGDGHSAFFVRDNGVGFDMAYAGLLFGAFQRLHKAREFPGTGIGLATVQRVIHRHGGRVWAEARVGEGATFNFTLGGNP